MKLKLTISGTAVENKPKRKQQQKEKEIMEAGKHLRHVGHEEHLLTLIEKGYGNCKMCYQNIINAPSYVCTLSCDFQIHKSCGELPQTIDSHYFHPRHSSLSMVYSSPPERSDCSVCMFSGSGFFYKCDGDRCYFGMHIECASLKPNLKYQGHQHLLAFIDNNYKTYFRKQCEACDSTIMSPFSVCCVECEIRFHVQCGLVPLSPSINLPKHHNHPLLLSSGLDEDDSFLRLHCDMCKKETIKQEYPFYSCSCAECDFNAHACCVLTEIEVTVDGYELNHIRGREKRIHFSHDHFLTLLKNERNYDSLCSGCQKCIQGPEPAYACDLCQFYLHKSCMDLPANIQHPFHIHPISLQFTYSHRECRACHKYCYDVIYGCDECHFYLDITCASLQPSISYQGHDHLLTLFHKLYFTPKCVICNFASCDSPVLRCVLCNFNVHLLCSPLPQNIVHENHQHSLILVDSFVRDDYPDQLFCDVCKKERDPRECIGYYCASCNFMVEFNCVISEVIRILKGELRELQLTIVNRLIVDKVVGEKRLTIQDISDSIQERSKIVDDISEESTENQGIQFAGGGEREKEIKNRILHEHPLTLCENEGEVFHCPACGDPFLGQFYSCSNCDFDPQWCFACGQDYSLSGSYYICKKCWPNTPVFHQPCAELPLEIQIRFHPHGSLHLVEKIPSLSYKMMKLDTSKIKNRLRFCCDECSLEIGYECATMLKQCHDGREIIKHTRHDHPMTLMKDKAKGDSLCQMCLKNIKDSTSFGCTDCKFYIHQTCFELPTHIRHPFHDLKLEISGVFLYCEACGFHIAPDTYHMKCYACQIDLHLDCARSLTPNIKYSGHKHLVTLIDNVNISSQRREWDCNACGFGFHGAPFLRCVECDVNFHEQCDVTMLEQNNNGGKLKHYSHPHALDLWENIENDGNVCKACEKRIQGRATYGCDFCSYYLHKSCADLPRQIQHRFHEHVLSLPEPYSGIERQCNACQKRSYGFTYGCEDCKFYMDLDCVPLSPSVISNCHEHKLTLLDKLYGDANCKAKYCNSTSPNAKYLRCVRCNFTMHLWCAPIPETLPHESHHHPLTIKVKVYNDVYDEEVCDVCEEKRHQQECAYYCEECDFVAEFNCMLSKVLPFLKRKRRDVQLTSIYNLQMSEKVIEEALFSDNILDYITEDEKKELETIFNDMDKEMDCISESSHSYDHNETLLLQVVIKFKFCAPKTKEEFWSPYKFFGYNISEGLASVRKKLLEKYGDVGANFAFTNPDLKAAFIVRLCWIVQSMRRTRIIDISDKLMFNWWYHLKFVEHGGIKIDFAYNHLKSLANARTQFTYADAERHKGIPIYELQEEVAQLTRKIKEQMDIREEHKNQIQIVIATQYPEGSRAKANRISDALESIMKDAGRGLL